jgi:hypothetical protein
MMAVDLDAVRDDLAGVVTRTLEPAHVSIWISRPGWGLVTPYGGSGSRTGARRVP